MEIKKTLNVPAAYFYTQVLNSVLYDVRKHTGKSVAVKDLENYSYVKEFSKNSRAKITIEKLRENEAYHYNTSTTKNTFTAQYNITPLDDSSCEVVYKEEMKSYGALQKINDKVLGLVLGYFKKKQFVNMLEAIEKSY